MSSMAEPNIAKELSTSEQEFRAALRRRNRWTVAAPCSGGLGLLLAFIGMEARSSLSLGLAGCAFAVAGVSIGQLTANGYVAPAFGKPLFGWQSVRDKQYTAAFVLVLWGIFCVAVAFQLK